MKIILFGGNFDPIHNGHINIANAASKQFDAKVIFIPSKQSVWKTSEIGIKDKVNMVTLAIKPFRNMEIDLFEANKKENVWYSIDTVKHFLNKYKNDELYFLIGSDQVNNFYKWKNADELSKIIQIIFYIRPGYKPKTKYIKKYNMKRVYGNLIDESSTNIKILGSLNINPEVKKYIENNRLYYVNQLSNFMSDRLLNHCISVGNLAYQIAETHNLPNKDDYYIAGLLHDLGKENKNKTEIINKYYKKYVNVSPQIYHQFVGEYLAKKLFGIKNKDILNAIKYHTTGNKYMSNLSKVIYASDKIDPLREYDSSTLIKSMIELPIDEGFKIVLNANKAFLENKKIITNDKLTLKCYKQYL